MFNVSARNDLKLQSDLCESLFIEINLQQQKNVIVGIIYRDPKSSIADFNIQFNKLLESFHKENKQIYLMGDVNIDLIKCSLSKNINDFINIVYDNAFHSVIDKPTRITRSSASLIDHIFTNVVSKQMYSGILYSDITDHLPVFLIVNNFFFQYMILFLHFSTSIQESNIIINSIQNMN